VIREHPGAPGGGRETKPQAADHGASRVGGVDGADQRRAREPAQPARGGEPLLPERDQAAGATDGQHGEA